MRAKEGGFAGALLLDYGKLHAPDADGYQEPEKSLVVECPWRLENETHVIAGSGDRGEVIGARIQACVGKPVLQTRVHLPSYMACIRFAGDLILWIFPDSSSDYAVEEEYLGSPFYVTGRAISGDWED